MVHVTEENVAIIDSDLLIRECINASGGDDSFAFVISPFISDYKIPSSAISFTSNAISISDVDFFTDLIRLLTQEGGDVSIVCRSPRNLSETGMGPSFVRKQKRIIMKFQGMNCKVRIENDLHAKATVTSTGALYGSFNLTRSGRFYNIETGSFISKAEGGQREEYMDKLSWARETFDGGEEVENRHLQID